MTAQITRREKQGHATAYLRRRMKKMFVPSCFLNITQPHVWPTSQSTLMKILFLIAPHSCPFSGKPIPPYKTRKNVQVLAGVFLPRLFPFHSNARANLACFSGKCKHTTTRLISSTVNLWVPSPGLPLVFTTRPPHNRHTHKSNTFAR